MDLGGLKNVLREAALLNLRYYSSLVDLSRNYLDTLKHVVEAGGAMSASSAPAPRQSEASPPAVPPLLLAARAGQRAEGAFAIVNNFQQPVVATIQVTGDIDPTKLRLSPESATLAPGEQRVVRIAVDIDDAMEVGRDRHATISIPGLGNRTIPFVLRRLPDASSAEASGETARSSAAMPPQPAAPTSATPIEAAPAPTKRKNS